MSELGNALAARAEAFEIARVSRADYIARLVALGVDAGVAEISADWRGDVHVNGMMAPGCCTFIRVGERVDLFVAQDVWDAMKKADGGRRR